MDRVEILIDGGDFVGVQIYVVDSCDKDRIGRAAAEFQVQPPVNTYWCNERPFLFKCIQKLHACAW